MMNARSIVDQASSGATASRPQVFHVAESFAGGVAAAIHDYRRNAPMVSHHLVYAPRGDAPLTRESLDGFDSVRRLPDGHFSRVASIRTLAMENPDAIFHAHSSFGGFYTRLAFRESRRRPIVYTPHCYSFERTDVGFFPRLLFRSAEALLALNTTWFAACSKREAQLSAWPVSRATRSFLPNVAPRDIETLEISHQRPGKLLVAGSGRFGAQKDPEYFVHVIRELRSAGLSFDAMWVGGGSDERLNALMAEQDIQVTGWLPRSEALESMRLADIYVHSARWEGFPVGVLEVAALGIATVVRDIPAFDGVDVPLRINRPRDIVDIWPRLEDVEHRARNVAVLRAALSECSDRAQQESLARIYGSHTADINERRST